MFVFRLLVLTLAGFSLAQDMAPATRSGFLGDYSALKAEPKSSFINVYRLRDGVLAEYDKCLVDPVMVVIDPEEGGSGFDPRHLVQLSDFFRQAVLSELSKVDGLTLVDEPGPGTARLRLAITGLNASKGWANAGLKIGVTAAGGIGLLVPSVNVGGASIEGEVIDAQSGQRLVAFTDSAKGRRMFNFRSIKKWGDAKKAFRRWARVFAETLTHVRSEQP